MADPDASDDRTDIAPVTRDEYLRLLHRVARLEEALLTQRQSPAPPPAPVAPAPVAPAPVAPAPVAPAPQQGAPVPLVPMPAPPPPSPARVAPQPARPAGPGFEAMLGQRFAPRIGAVLVFLAALFFLGVGIQRGWIGPVAQLGLAAAASAALLGIAAWLTRQKGYGTYPQVLEGTAASILYATAFVAHAVPYYQEQTGLSEVGGGLLMATVAAATVGLALLRDSRVIVGLGYALAFLTAGLGTEVLPALTVPYVAILGASLALIVARRGWTAEGLVGSAVTGAFFVAFAFDAIRGEPSPALVLGSAAVPLVALLWLSLRPAERGARDGDLAGLLALVTLGWGAAASAIPFHEDALVVGLILLAWTLVAGTLAVVATAGAGTPRAATAHGAGAVALYLVAMPWLWSDTMSEDLLVTLSYAGAALALALVQRAVGRGSRGAWLAGLTLAGAAALKAVFHDGWVGAVEGERILGPWEAWMTFLVLFPALALLVALAPRGEASGYARAAFAIGVGYLGVWAFALFGLPFLATMHLLLVGLALVAVSTRQGGAGLARDASLAGLLLVGAAAVKSTAYDPYATEPAMPMALALLESVVVAGALLVLHHLRAARPGRGDRLVETALVGGSAIVLASFLFAYATGPWTSVLLGILGVAYLATGFVLRAHAVYRYVGFAALGLVLLRVFTVDLREADLVVRAAVFAALGLILLAVGYVYARASRAKEPAAPATSAAVEQPPPPPTG